MKKGVFKKAILVLLILCMAVPTVYGTGPVTKAYVTGVSEQLDTVRKQLMAIAENGYINHVNKQSNAENIKRVKFFMEPLAGLKTELKDYKEQETNAFKKRNLNGLLVVANYLEDMGDNLVQYLSVEDPKQQFAYNNINSLTNQFIISILGSIENAKWEEYGN
ncbi:MAG: hypothetical protein ACRCW2_01420 [Cellulosilyticaceae bacterium]